MLIRSFKDAEAAGREIPISHGNSTAVRVLLASDGLGFSLSEARCSPGKSSDIWYKNHWEANYVRAGRGELTNRTSGEVWQLVPGTLYCVGPNDKHTVSSSFDPLRIVSVFNPPLKGLETHDEDGDYPSTGDVPEGHEHMFVRTIYQVRDTDDEKVMADGNVVANRLLTSADKLGFSLSEVTVKEGCHLDLWYKNHYEVNLVLEGEAFLTDRNSGKDKLLSIGDVYCVGPDDPHRLSPITDLKLLAIFKPPLAGDERHHQDGAYPPTGPAPPGPQPKVNQ